MFGKILVLSKLSGECMEVHYTILYIYFFVYL